ncbi:hypothetical protein BC939DRAFT_528529 [Gamsiella multidivaricata]|uniref:uncharacterized protein n=1 Tax=Gamsiella multidivaricata TaxID=101098 RepID=UPI0022201940|nr:uncharacterized protein BC939DRAFT_528529 [Gamsiella multidivaricata]KAI7824327.1 hypothetical protein BC939DRAFT_528529 [Gamsiella multidivaricata]
MRKGFTSLVVPVSRVASATQLFHNALIFVLCLLICVLEQAIRSAGLTARTISFVTHAAAIISDDIKLDSRSFVPLTITDEMAGMNYDPHRLSTSIYNAIQNPVDAHIVSVPDYAVLKDSIMKAKKNHIPIIALYTGLQADEDIGILAVKSDEFEAGRLIGAEFLSDGVGYSIGLALNDTLTQGLIIGNPHASQIQYALDKALQQVSTRTISANRTDQLYCDDNVGENDCEAGRGYADDIVAKGGRRPICVVVSDEPDQQMLMCHGLYEHMSEIMGQGALPHFNDYCIRLAYTDLSSASRKMVDLAKTYRHDSFYTASSSLFELVRCMAALGIVDKGLLLTTTGRSAASLTDYINGKIAQG